MKQLYEQFQTAILIQDDAVRNSIKPHSRLTAAQQLSIYQEGYRIRLSNAIMADYPALTALLGQAALAPVIAQYIDAHPPRSYTLDVYPFGFAAFFCQHSQDVFAAELAVLEGAIAEVFMLPETLPLSPQQFTAFSPEVFAETALPLRAASRLVSFSHPVQDWLSAFRAGGELPPRPSPAAQYLFLVRHQHEVKRHVLHPAAFALLMALSEGKNVSEALEQVLTQHPDYAEDVSQHLQLWFAQWVENGVFQQ